MSQEGIYLKLGWPSRDQMMTPLGVGPKIIVEEANQKIGRPLRRYAGVASISIGVLVPNPNSNSLDTPFAIVCEFGKQVTDAVLREAHRLTWSFSKAPLLITVEPTLLRVWSCYQRPGISDSEWRQAEIEDLQVRQDTPDIEAAVLRSLHWTGLLSGYLFYHFNDKFQENGRADRTLLKNLIFVRKELRKEGLAVDTAHDLLARIIFIQFLFHRKDASGQPALNEDLLQQLFLDGVLSREYRSLEEILMHYQDAYNFFKWLNNRFNGDLFPGKGDTSEERDAEWHKEMNEVTPDHLRLLAQFVAGSLILENGQNSLWPLYQFDAIPLEFISSIYEEFVNDQRSPSDAHYTPSHLVDFILDGVLPWDGQEWDVKVLDPACGSGIFLVKAFQRLIYRWRMSNNDEPSPTLLAKLLTDNLRGVDINPQAVRVASFSLYLAMCDAIDPRRYWQEVKFPRLRNKYLLAVDFFSEDINDISTEISKSSYDIVVGNAPWGKKALLSADVNQWSLKYGWKTINKDIGTLFLVKSALLTKSTGYVAMLQPASYLLFNRSPTAVAFRAKFFNNYKVEEIINFSALRFGLFADSISPTVCVIFRPTPPDGEPISYICIKPTHTSEDSFRMVIEPHDISEVLPEEAATDGAIWSIKMWGGNRDQELIQKLKQRNTLRKLEQEGIAKIRKGVVWANKKQYIDIPQNFYCLLDQKNFPDGSFPELATGDLPVINELSIDSAGSPDMEPFHSPQLLIKKAWQVALGRFQAVLHLSRENSVICNQSYVSVHIPMDHKLWLESAFISMNSRVAVYYLMLTSGRFASYRPEPLLEDFRSVPLPEPHPDLISHIDTPEDIDIIAVKAMMLSEVDEFLINDLFDYTLPDFHSGGFSPARKSAHSYHWRENDSYSDDLVKYCDVFIKVIESGFGEGKSVCATIYRVDTNENMDIPVQIVAIHLQHPQGQKINNHEVTETDVFKELSETYNRLLRGEMRNATGVIYHRVLMWYDVPVLDGNKVPTVFIVKPNQVRYWLRSVALRDADKVASDLLTWSTYESPHTSYN